MLCLSDNPLIFRNYVFDFGGYERKAATGLEQPPNEFRDSSALESQMLPRSAFNGRFTRKLRLGVPALVATSQMRSGNC